MSDTNIDFKNLLLNQSVTKRITIENICKIPVKVFLNNLDDAKTEFVFSTKELIIKQFEESYIDITFCSSKQNKFEYNFTLE